MKDLMIILHLKIFLIKVILEDLHQLKTIKNLLLLNHYRINDISFIILKMESLNILIHRA